MVGFVSGSQGLHNYFGVFVAVGLKMRAFGIIIADIFIAICT